jgi:hypothetical protein
MTSPAVRADQLWRHAGQSLLGAGLVAAGAAALGAASVRSPKLAVGLVLLALAMLIVAILPARLLIAGLIVYLPLEGWILGWAPHSVALVLRYAPEALCILALCVIAAGRGARVDRWKPIVPAIVATVACWLFGAVVAHESAVRAAIGIRAELRWVPLCLIVALTTNPERDSRIFGRAILASGYLQAGLALVEFAVPSLRPVFAPNYNIALGGVTVATSSKFRPDSVGGTLANYNALSTFLLFVWIVALAAGPALKLPRWVTWLAAVLFPIIIVASGSRESAMALLVAGAVIARLRYGVPVLRIAALVAVCGAIALPVVTNTATTNGANRANLGSRFAVLLNPATYSPNTTTNFRYAVLAQDAELTWHHSPILGFGVGSVVDPRSVIDRSNPLYLTPAGQIAIQQSYIFDGNWNIILTETGFLGLALTAVLLLTLGRLGWTSRTLWTGLTVAVMTAVIVVLGFYESILQAQAIMVFWVMLGCVLASRAQSAYSSELPSLGP